MTIRWQGDCFMGAVEGLAYTLAACEEDANFLSSFLTLLLPSRWIWNPISYVFLLIDSHNKTYFKCQFPTKH